MVHLALLILRPIPSSIRPFLGYLNLTVDEYDNEWNDKKHEFLDLSKAQSDLSQALSDPTIIEHDNKWNDKKHEFLDLYRAPSDLTQALSGLTVDEFDIEWNYEFSRDFKHFFAIFDSSLTNQL